jgi:hypothetical protein
MPRAIALFIPLIGLLALTTPGCATMLVPGPGAHRVPGVGYAADAREAGIHVVASAEAWTGLPSDLDDFVTPLLVTITNDSERALEVRYENFALQTPGGVIFAALPPFQVTGFALEPLDTMGIGPMVGYGFSVAPYLSPWYPGWSIYGGPFPFNSGYYGGYSGFYSSYGRVSLPTGDMIQRALPEGVLAPGGRISGFVYFERVIDVVRVAFVAHLIEVGGQAFGMVQIPFVVEW